MKRVYVTTSWDDGHVLDLRLADMLKKYGIRGTFFISPKDHQIAESKRLTPLQIKELSKDFEIGAHTMTHPDLTRLSDEDAREEIVQSKTYLEEIIGKTVASFCYPSGFYDARHARIAKEAGFTSARTVKRFKTRYTDPFSLPTTIHAYRHWSDLFSILKAAGVRRFIRCYLNWDELAIHVFEQTRARGGTYHLWGHSWEIDARGDWGRLERVLAHIARYKDEITCVTEEALVSTYAKRPQTVLISSPYFFPHGGGLERYVYEIAKGLKADTAWNVVVVTSGGKHADTHEFYNGIEVYRLGYQFKISNTPFSFLWRKKIRALIEQEEPNLINIHTPVPGIGDMTASLAGDIPVVVTYHTDSMKKGSSIADFLVSLYERGPLRVLLSRAQHIICSSDYIRFNFLKAYVHKSTTITPAVDMNLFKPDLSKKETIPTLLFVAGLKKAEQYKGLHTLLLALARVCAVMPRVRLRVVGDGDMLEGYRSIARKLGLTDVVTFVGHKRGAELAEEYQRAHAFVLPSEKESFGMVLLEAMACALPTIGSTTGGIPLLIDEGKTGLTFTANNSEALSQKILELLSDTTVMARMGEEGLKKVQGHYQWSERVAATRKLFSEVQSANIRPLIVQIAAYYPPHVGGLERVAKMASESLALKGWNVCVFTSSIGAHSGVERSRNLSVYRLKSFEFAHTPFAFMLPLRLLFLPKKSIMHVHLSQAFWSEMVYLVHRVRGIPYIAHFHLDVGPSGPLGVLFMILKKLTWKPFLKNAAKVVVFSSDQKQLVHEKYGVPLSSISVIPNGVDDAFFGQKKHRSQQTLRLIAVSRLSIQKRVERLIEAMTLINVPAQLTIVGDGDEREDLESLVRLKKLENVTFVGFKPNGEVRKHFEESDAFLISSDHEGMPIAVLEAMASGLPVVGSDVIGIRELVSEAGILVNAPYAEAFAEAIGKLYRDPSLYEQLSADSIRVASEYSCERFIQRFEEAYVQAL